MTSPISIDTPTPSDLGEAIDIVAHNDTRTVFAFWGSQLKDFAVLTGCACAMSEAGYRETRPLISSATGHIDDPLLVALIQTLQIGDQRWAAQFAHGLRPPGISVRRVYYSSNMDLYLDYSSPREFPTSHRIDSNWWPADRLRPANNLRCVRPLKKKTVGGLTRREY